MNRTLSFVRLDFYTVKPYRKSFMLLIALAIAMTVSFQSLSALYSYIMMSLILTTSYPFSIGEKNGLNTLYATLPLCRKNVVAGRYLFALFMELSGSILVLFLSLTFSVFTSIEFVAPETIFFLCAASLVFSLMVAIQYPVYFKLGYDKAKFIAYIPFLIFYLCFLFVPKLLKNANITINFDDVWQILMEYPLLACGLPVIAGLLLLAISYLITVKLSDS